MKKLFASFLQKSALNSRLARKNSGRTKILLYHSVVKRDEFEPSLDPADQCLTENEFESTLIHLKNNFNIISLDAFFSPNVDKKGINVVITFDDGFLNNFTVAYPILKKYDIPATFFITTSFASGEKLLSHTTAKEKKFFAPMHWEHIISMSKDPLITIGSHSRHHAPLTTIDEKKLYDEVFISKRLLEEKTGKIVKYISYPRGAFNDAVLGAVKRDGYAAGLTTIRGFNDSQTDPFALRRNAIGNRGNLAILYCILSGSWDLFKKNA